jgi:hypothetical protein
MAYTSEDMCLGSGSVYMLLKDTENATMPTIASIAVSGNLAGHIQSGFTVSYKGEYVTDKDDSGAIEKTMLKAEEVKAKFGVVTWDGSFIEKCAQTVSVDTTTTAGKRITKIGGIANATMSQYWICFVPDDTDRIDAVQLLGICTSGFDFAFGEKACKVEPEFEGKPFDTDGHKLMLTETV